MNIIKEIICKIMGHSFSGYNIASALPSVWGNLEEREKELEEKQNLVCLVCKKSIKELIK